MEGGKLKGLLRGYTGESQSRVRGVNIKRCFWEREAIDAHPGHQHAQAQAPSYRRHCCASRKDLLRLTSSIDDDVPPSVNRHLRLYSHSLSQGLITCEWDEHRLRK
eukprot:scaffold78917_cov33-Tisochrysis_lutea.AAC.1